MMRNKKLKLLRPLFFALIFFHAMSAAVADDFGGVTFDNGQYGSAAFDGMFPAPMPPQNPPGLPLSEAQMPGMGTDQMMQTNDAPLGVTPTSASSTGAVPTGTLPPGIMPATNDFATTQGFASQPLMPTTPLPPTSSAQNFALPMGQPTANVMTPAAPTSTDPFAQAGGIAPVASAAGLGVAGLGYAGSRVMAARQPQTTPYFPAGYQPNPYGQMTMQGNMLMPPQHYPSYDKVAWGQLYTDPRTGAPVIKDVGMIRRMVMTKNDRALYLTNVALSKAELDMAAASRLGITPEEYKNRTEGRLLEVQREQALLDKNGVDPETLKKEMQARSDELDKARELLKKQPKNKALRDAVSQASGELQKLRALDVRQRGLTKEVSRGWLDELKMGADANTAKKLLAQGTSPLAQHLIKEPEITGEQVATKPTKPKKTSFATVNADMSQGPNVTGYGQDADVSAADARVAAKTNLQTSKEVYATSGTPEHANGDSTPLRRPASSTKNSTRLPGHAPDSKNSTTLPIKVAKIPKPATSQKPGMLARIKNALVGGGDSAHGTTPRKGKIK